MTRRGLEHPLPRERVGGEGLCGLEDKGPHPRETLRPEAEGTRRVYESGAEDAPYAAGARADGCGPCEACLRHDGLHRSTRAQPDHAILTDAATGRRRPGCVVDVFPPRRGPGAPGGTETGAPAHPSGAGWVPPLARVAAALPTPRSGVAGIAARGRVVVHGP